MDFLDKSCPTRRLGLDRRPRRTSSIHPCKLILYLCELFNFPRTLGNYFLGGPSDLHEES